MKVVLVSLNQSWKDKSENQKKVKQSLELIFQGHNQIDLIVYPEMTLTGFTMDSNEIKEEIESSQTISFFQGMAQRYNVAIAFGVVLANKNKATNNLIIVNNQGEIISNYAKIHPFSYAKEDDNYLGGEEIVISSVDNEKVGVSICYDLRFPELYQILSKDAKIIINIANWPKARVEHWSSLLKARAIENQVYMIGVNRTGVDGNEIEYVKSSMIISPYGETLRGKVISETIEIYDLNTSIVSEYRKDFPVKNDRKIELYKNML